MSTLVSSDRREDTPAHTVVRVTGLSAHAADRPLIEDVTFALRAGRVTALMGPSGSGKTTTALALLGDCGAGVRLSGSVEVAGHRVVDDASSPGELAAARSRVRGRLVAFLPQHADEACNPSRRVGSTLTEVARVHNPGAGRAHRRRLVAEALARAQLPADRAVLRRYPHQFSGGQRRRIVLAQTLLCSPDVLVLDEPTTGLDAGTSAGLVRDLAGVAGTGVAILLLSHDADVVRALADDLWVVEGGRVRPATIAAPTSPPVQARRVDRVRPAVVAAESITASYRGENGRHPVLRDVDLRIDADECVGLVGRSGSGKTTLARCLAGLHPIESGRIHLHGVSVPMLGQRSADQVKRIQYVWQDVAGSFDPARPVVDQVMRTAQRLGGRDAVSARRETQACLASLGLPADTVGRRPRALSGGELRRAALARALLAEPDLLIGDEITSSLDAERAVEILTLLNDLRRITGMALLLISHDQALLERSADRIVSLDELWSGAATA